MSRSKTIAVAKGNKKQNLSRKAKTTQSSQKNQLPKIALVIPATEYTDRHGRSYQRNTEARTPFTGHAIRYPNEIEDEDIPIQIGNVDECGVNGASELLLAIALIKSLESKLQPSHYENGARIFMEMAAKMLLAEDIIEKDFRSIYTPEQLARLKVDLDALKILNATDTIQRMLTSLRDKITVLEKNMGEEVRAYIANESEPSAELEPVLKYIGNVSWANDSPPSS